MSADNYYYIAKREGRWLGVMVFASHDYSDAALELELARPNFVADSLEEAIRLAQSEYTEYGYAIEVASL